MSQPFFEKSDASRLFFLQEQPPAGLGGYRCVFLPPSGITPPSPLDLSGSFAIAGGLYLFLNSPPQDEAAFIDAVQNYLAKQRLDRARFMWLSNPNDSPVCWNPFSLTMEPDGTLGRLAQFPLRNYMLALGASCMISLNDQAEPTGFEIRQNTTGDRWIYLDVFPGKPFYSTDSRVTLSFTGPSTGSLGFGISAGLEAGTDSPGDLDVLDAGIRYYFNDPENPGYLLSLRYRIFSGKGTLPLQVFFDPLNPEQGTRTFFGLPAGEPPLALDSCFQSWVGMPLKLSPEAGGDTKFVFAPYAQTPWAQDTDPYTLIPSGVFRILLPQRLSSDYTQPAVRLLAGTSALEYLGFPADEGNLLYFIPGKPAYAPCFSITPGQDSTGQARLGVNTQDTLLSDQALTSYVYVSSGQTGTAGYYAQPENCVMYHLEQQTPTGTPLLDYMEIPFKALPLPQNLPEQAFSMVPYGDLPNLYHGEYFGSFEIQVLSPARRLTINALAAEASSRKVEAVSAQCAADPVSLGTTNHGWLAQFNDQRTIWQTLTLASARGGTQQLVLAGPEGGNISGVLRDALQTNRLFLVAEGSKFSALGAFLSSVLSIESFSFDLNTEMWPDQETIFIMKYTGSSVLELASDLNRWTGPLDFSEGAVTRQHLLGILQDAVQMAATNTYFQDFAAIIQDPFWNGILALNVFAPLWGLPPELAGLAGGIDPDEFKAHHLGIQVSPVEVQDTGGLPVLTMKESSLFGLIYYNSDSILQQSGPPYQYQVKNLSILFENSAIKQFACSVELLVNELFGETVRLQNCKQDPNVMVFNGKYQDLDGRKIFTLNNLEANTFKADGRVLDEVEILSASFITETTEEEQKAGKDIQTRFSFQGNLRFNALEGFDLFSFGSEIGDTGEKGQLNFLNLSVKMSFPQASPEIKTFTFDAQDLSFNQAASKARRESLYSHFPLKLKGFVQGQEGGSPKSMGFNNVTTPISESSLFYPWFGLLFELNLGSLGALAANAGFTAKLLAAWSPGQSGISVFTGISIPGTGESGKIFSIQSILKISVDQFRIEAGLSPGGHTSYVLILNNIRLDFMGKKLPSSAYTDLALFGNPDPAVRADSLGWYAAYTDEKK